MALLNNNRPVIGDTRPTVTARGEKDHINAASGKAQATVLIGGKEDIDAAVAAAVAGQKVWMAMSGDGRRDALFRLADLIEHNRDEFVSLAALECGTPVIMGGGVDLALSWIRYYAGWADKVEGSLADPLGAQGIAYSRHEPIGIIGVIIPWNSPLVATMMTAILALAGGNAVVLKPPTQTPFAAIRIGELALEAGLPPGALNIVPGDAEAGEALITHEKVGKISFTGGDSVARMVMHAASDHLKPLALELGGKSANIIFDDADLDAAAAMSTACSLMALSGQGCVFPTRVYAQNGIFDALIERVAAIANSYVVGDPIDTGTMVGPVINEEAAVRIMGVIDRAKAESGGKLIAGGNRGDGPLANGSFVQPTVFADIDHQSNLAQEEVFGPVLGIMRFSSEEEAIAKANDSRFGLGAYLHTHDLGRAHRMAAKLEAGAVSVNGMLPMTPNMPFGGYKQSGFGREGGRPGLEEFMQIKHVMVHL